MITPIWYSRVMKVYTKIVHILAGALATWALSSTQPDYNPNFADAIELKRPESCNNIDYALILGQTDGIEKIYGEEAVKLCKEQAVTGRIFCECDQKQLLDDMRKKWWLHKIISL